MNQKPPTISSCDTGAELTDISHKDLPLWLEYRIYHRMASECAGRAAGSQGTIAIPHFHSLRKRAETVNPAPSRSTDVGDTTRVSSSRRTILAVYPKVSTIWRAAGVRMIIIMVGKIRRAMGMIILIGAL